MEALIVLAIFGAIAFAIAHFLGRKRQIGFGWSLFFCIFLSPIIGFIIVMLSRKYFDENPKPSTGKKVWGWILIVLSVLSFLGRLMMISQGVERNPGDNFNQIFIAVGLFGLGYYLIELSKGKNFNTEALTKSDE